MFRARGAGDQRKTAAERPGVQPGRPPTAPRRAAEAQARGQRAEHERRGPAPHIAKPDVQEGAESASGGLGAPVAFLSNRRDKPAARGQRSGTPGAAKHGA